MLYQVSNEWKCGFMEDYIAHSNKGIEDYKDVPKVQEIKWEMDNNMYEHFKSLNLIDDEPPRIDFFYFFFFRYFFNPNYIR